VASFKDVAAALGLEPGATPDDALARIEKMRAETAALSERFAALEARTTEIERDAQRTVQGMLEGLGARAGRYPGRRAICPRTVRGASQGSGSEAPGARATARRGRQALLRARPDGRSGTRPGEWGTFEPGEMLDPEHATKIVRGMTEGEQFRTE
jgi:hypothetical protein